MATKLDAVTFEILRHRLWQISDEMAVIMKRVSGSPVTTEAGDFSVALYCANGDVMVVGSGVTLHVSTTSMVCKRVLERFGQSIGIAEEDMYLFNDPYLAVAHQPDISIVSPVFYEGRLIAWTGTMSHMVDIGGIDPGGFSPRAVTVYQEGLRFPGVRIVRDGELQQDLFDSIVNMVREPGLVGLDLKAQIAANNVGKARLLSLIDRYGMEVIGEAMDALIDYSERRIRARLAELPDGTWRTVEYLDHDGHSPKIYRISLAMTKRADRLTFDFTDTSEQAPGFINSTYPAARGGVFSALAALLCYDIPWNDGLLRPVELLIPEGSMLNPTFPTPVSMGSIGAANSAGNAATVTLSKMMGASERYKDEVFAVWRGGPSVANVSGYNRDGRFFASMFMDQMAGGCGARSWADGVDTGGYLPVPRGICPNVERYEHMLPILYLFRRQASDSGGAGKFRGGCGGEYAVCLHRSASDVLTCVFCGAGAEPPVSTGLFGGYPAANLECAVYRNSGVSAAIREGSFPVDLAALAHCKETHPAKAIITVGTDDILYSRWLGGGGYGDPIERDPALVNRDLANGLVCQTCAELVYGVSLLPSGELDERRTEERRQAIHLERIGHSPIRRNAGSPAATKRLGPVSASVELASTPEGVVFQCARCGHSHGDSSQDWRHHAIVRDSAITKASCLMTDSPNFVLTEFYCAGCGVQADVQTRLRGDALVRDALDIAPR